MLRVIRKIFSPFFQRGVPPVPGGEGFFKHDLSIKTKNSHYLSVRPMVDPPKYSTNLI
jgi:hypothetical protein